MEEQMIELFFNAGDIKKQENFIIYPKSLDRNQDKWNHADDYEELLHAVSKPFQKEFSDIGYNMVTQIEKNLKENSLYC